MHPHKTIGVLLGLLAALVQPVALAQNAGPAFLLPSVSSSLGEPLQARLPLTGLAAGDGPFYSATLAASSAYQAQQMRRYQVVESIALQITTNGSGAQVLQLNSDSPMYEPSVRMLVELTGPRSTRILPLELLLPVAGDPGRSQRQILVYPNDTLWRVANRTREPEVSNNQQMLAMQRLNADAFLFDNINGLKEWSMLMLPTYAQAMELPRQEAAQVVAQQNARWQSVQRRGSGRQQSQSSTGVQPIQSDRSSASLRQSPSQTLGQVRITAVEEPNRPDPESAKPALMPSEALAVQPPETPWSGEPTFTESLTDAPESDGSVASAAAETDDLPEEMAAWSSGQPIQPAEPEILPPAQISNETAAPQGTTAEVHGVPGINKSEAPSNGEDPFDLAQLEAQIRGEEAGFDSRLLKNLMSPRGIGLLAGIVFIALLVMLLLRRRSVEQEQALNRALPDEEPLIGHEVSGQSDDASDDEAPDDEAPDDDGIDSGSDTEAAEFVAEADAEAEPEPEPEAEPEPEDVYITRLKLAEAYLEMGDVDGATEMLEEVMADGNPEQQEVARRIMERVAGNDD